MPEKPDEARLRSELSARLDANKQQIQSIMNSPPNKDVIFRAFVVGGVDACLVFLDGMAGRDVIDEFILRPCMGFAGELPCEKHKRADYLAARVLEIDDAELVSLMKELVEAVLSGKTALLVDGSNQAAVLETRAYEKRSVDTTRTESVVQGPQEGFVENLKTNLTLVRRIVRSEMLISESLSVGKLPTQVAMLYLKGVAKQSTVDLVRRRINSLAVAQCPGSGYLQQLLEDHPYSLFPQMMQTERPDRAASCLSDGQIALLVDGSPYALVAPITFFHLLHAPDDTFMRWQYGTFVRVIRLLGMFISLFLSSFYVAVTLYHSHMIPLDLLTSIAETRSRVPFPVVVEVLFMETSFFLLNEAGTRMPGLLGSALGIVGALILGQAAVEASVISPILIIVVALTGLGNYAIPNYGVSVGTQILRLLFIAAGALAGFYGIVLAGALLVAYLSWMTSFGEPYLAPVAPRYPHNGDILIRKPLFRQTKELFLAVRPSWLKSPALIRGWRRKP